MVRTHFFVVVESVSRWSLPGIPRPVGGVSRVYREQELPGCRTTRVCLPMKKQLPISSGYLATGSAALG